MFSSRADVILFQLLFESATQEYSYNGTVEVIQLYACWQKFMTLELSTAYKAVNQMHSDLVVQYAPIIMHDN